MNIVVLDGYTLNPGDLSWDILNELGTLKVYNRTSGDKVIERAKKAAIIFTNKVIISREVISELPELKYIGVLATGYNVVDTDAARERGITVTNIPAYGTDSVAQLVFAHILHFVNNIGAHALSVKKGDWVNSIDFSYQKTPQRELAGKTLGIIGFGKIGRAVAGIANAFGMKTVFHDPLTISPIPEFAIPVELDSLVALSDFISLNCPLTRENRGFINSEIINKMKPTAILINTGRGQLINEQDLADALISGKIAGAGLDVLSVEPPDKNNPLLFAGNCHITPHIAWATIEARTRLMDIAVSNVMAFLEGNPVNVVN
jgi:glycerate dehydrogenase